MSSFPPLNPSVVLGVGAHPDDLDFGAAASMAKFAGNGADVYYLLLTDGSKGSEDMRLTSKELVKIRQKEQRTALSAIGGRGITFMNYPDGALEVTMELKEQIVSEIRRLKPDVVVTMDPSVIYSETRNIINHPDHRAAGQATLDAVFPLARDHLSFPDLYRAGLEPHKVATLLLTNFDKSNYYIDVSEVIEKKWQALKAHASQIRDFESTKERLVGFAKSAGAKAGVNFAEGFVRLDLAG